LTEQTEAFSSGEASIELSPSPNNFVVSIQEIKLSDDTILKKWQDFFFDYQTKKIYFKTTPILNGTIKFNETTEEKLFVFNSKNEIKKDTLESFPLITIDQQPSPVTRIGQFNAPMQSKKGFQINVYTKEGFIYTDGNGVQYEGDSLGDYICYQIVKLIREFEEQLHPAVYDLLIQSDPEDLPFDYELQANHKILILQGSLINIGEFEL